MFSGRAGTANGMVRTAPVWLENIEVGPMIDRDVRAQVNAGDMDVSLLGMDYLRRYASIEIAGERNARGRLSEPIDIVRIDSFQPSKACCSN